ncbi:MAG: TDT family transporter [Lactobacillales bacterium]|nr:TDT family transporter [Lactobacillales bacterium]
MKNFLKKVPIPICGLMLGLASLGNLLKSYNLFLLGNICGVIAAIIFLLVLSKILLTFRHVKDTLADPIVASVSPTFTMGTMVLTTYIYPIPSLALVAKIIWFVAIVLHYCLMFYFVYNFLIKPNVTIEHLYPSWFIVFVGLGVIAVTSPNYSVLFGQINFWIGLFFYLLLLPMIIHRVFRVKNMPNPTLPLITIIAAPGSLELTGYLKAFPSPNSFLLFLLLALSQVLYLFIFTRIIKLFILSRVKKSLHLPFYPSYAAFTFPMVISAMAITTATKQISAGSILFSVLNRLAVVETGIACIIVLYVLVHYLVFFKKIWLESVK